MRRTTRLIGVLIIALLIVGFAEFMAYMFSCHLYTYSIGFTPLNITETYESYAGRHHPRLGWLPPPTSVDAAGSRPNPAFLDPFHNRTCVSLYGDSFTEGAGVDHENAWSTILSRLLQCRVANFGVSGYGTDQAYLRFLDNHGDQARLVILALLSENLMRNVNQLRNLISTSNACFLKPRFRLNHQNQLVLVPIPRLTKTEYDTLRTNPAHLLKHEFFIPGGPSGYRMMGFPYTWGVFKVLPLAFKNVVLRQGIYYDLYRPDHPSQAVAITSLILKEFYREARQRGKIPLILVIPTHVDLAYYRRHGKWIYHPVIDYLVAENLDFIDVGPAFLKYLGNSGLETLYSPKTLYHLNEKGNAVLAGVVYDHLKKEHLFPRGSTAGHHAPRRSKGLWGEIENGGQQSLCVSG